MRLSEKFDFLAVPVFFFQRIAPKLVANILVNINSGVLGVLLIIFFGDPICVQQPQRPQQNSKEKEAHLCSPELVVKVTTFLAEPVRG